jgi:WD40 repeat protein
VLRVDGSVQRDLSMTWNPTTATVNWLPTRVDPGLLPVKSSAPEAPTPVHVLQGRDWPYGILWSPDGERMVVLEDRSRYGGLPTPVTTLWDLRNGQMVWRRESEANFSVIWEAEPHGGYTARLEECCSDSVLAGDVTSPDGRLRLAEQAYGLSVVDNATGESLAKLSDVWRMSASFSPDSQLLAVGYAHRPAEIWDTRTWERVYVFPEARVLVAFSPDGKQLAASRSWDVEIWNVADLLAGGSE